MSSAQLLINSMIYRMGVGGVLALYKFRSKASTLDGNLKHEFQVHDCCFLKEKMLKVDLSAPCGGSFKVSASDLGLSCSKFSKIRVTLEAEQLDKTIRVVLEVCAQALLECDRTLREFVAPVSNSHEIVLYHQGQEPVKDDMIEQIELDPGQRMYDLTEAIRDTLVLAIPVRKVAPEAEEIQIQTVFGAPNLDADPRWSALLAVRKELS